YTLKNRNAIHDRPRVSSKNPNRRSPANFEMQYGVRGSASSFSLIGNFLGSPYTDALDANTNRSTPASHADSATCCVPIKLTSKLSVGAATLLLIANAARCTTRSTPLIAR